MPMGIYLLLRAGVLDKLNVVRTCEKRVAVTLRFSKKATSRYLIMKQISMI